MKDLRERERERERERVKWVTGPYGYETVGSYSTLINIVNKDLPRTQLPSVTVQLGQIKIKDK